MVLVGWVARSIVIFTVISMFVLAQGDVYHIGNVQPPTAKELSRGPYTSEEQLGLKDHPDTYVIGNGILSEWQSEETPGEETPGEETPSEETPSEQPPYEHLPVKPPRSEGANLQIPAYEQVSTKFIIPNTYDDICRILPAGITYTSRDIDCTEWAAFLEWYLERYGIPACIALSHDRRHSWVRVVTSKGESLNIDPTLGNHDREKWFKTSSYYNCNDIYLYETLDEAILDNGALNADQWDWYDTCLGDRYKDELVMRDLH